MTLATPAIKLEDFARVLTSATDGDLRDLAATRRGLILAPLLAALPIALLADPAHAIDPEQTQVILPDQYQWRPALPSAPAQSVETVPVFGATDKPGPYVVLVKWHPGTRARRTHMSPIGCALSFSGRRGLCRCPRADSCAALRTRHTTME